MKFTTASLLTSSLLASTGASAFIFRHSCTASSTNTGTCRRIHTLGAAPFSARGGASNTFRATSTTTMTDKVEETENVLSTSDCYKELAETLQGVTHLSRAASVLSYDQMVFMPQTDDASSERGKQSAALAAVIHEKSTDPKIGALLEQAELLIQNSQGESGDREAEAQRVVEMARKAYDKKVKIPTELASKAALLSSEAYNTWAKAREADDFSLFQTVLGQSIDISKQKASAIQTEEEKLAGKSLYATMLDEYEVGMDADRIDSIFGEIQDALVPLIERVFGPGATAPDTQVLQGEFDIPDQEALSRTIVRDLGFDATRGRIDVSVHPFSSSLSGRHDVRITSRFRGDEWYQGLAGSIHEAGHAMYEQNVVDSGPMLPLIDRALSMGMHESQSLFWERHVGLSRDFWKYAAPLANQHLKLFTDENENTVGERAEALYAAVNAANPSLIRVEADELTYPLHVILRYKIEREFIEGLLPVQDIPTEWNKAMKDMLGVDVPSDAKGCLQDVHWSMSAFGYFPTYLIGAATAAQLAHYCQRDIGEQAFSDQVRAGKFDEIRAWMTDKVHRHGSRYKSLDEHLQAQLGEPLNPKYFIDYLTNKYTDLYRCEIE